MAGWSKSEPEAGWRTYLVREMVDVQVLAERFTGTRPGYVPDDSRMRQLFCRLDGDG